MDACDEVLEYLSRNGKKKKKMSTSRAKASCPCQLWLNIDHATFSMVTACTLECCILGKNSFLTFSTPLENDFLHILKCIFFQLLVTFNIKNTSSMITTSCLEILRVICILITSLWTSLDMLFTRFNNNNNIVIFF